METVPESGHGADDAELEELVFRCLEAGDAQAELERRTADRPELAERALGLLQRIAADRAESPPARSDGLPSVRGYRVVRELGAGGMGAVYLAEQREPVRRQVALKVIKAGLGTEQVLRRFELERQALALMNHDAIARVFDAGATDDGFPFFAMEFVPGVPLTEHCDKARLSMRERLELFGQVCEGVQHAHQKGVIHRDLKPGNILVSAEQGRAVPKIIDFGLARATDRQLSGATLYTEHGQLLGTPAYMSPEQAEMSAQDVDTRTDVYSLGVVLYELLTGQLPFSLDDLRDGGLLEMQRRICHDDPPRPSTRVSSAGDDSTRAARLRQTTRTTLSRDLRGDLDWIVMKALHKDRNRRYATASELAADVERHLNDEPVTAHAPSTAYRIGKFVRRYRVQVAAAAAVVLALTAGFAVSLALYFEASAQRQRAEKQEGLAEKKAAEALAQKERADREATAATRQRDRALAQSYTANLYAAVAALDRGATAGAKRRLQLCPAGLRGWEWGHLALRANQSIGGWRGPLDGTLAIHPDGRRIATAGAGVCTVFDAETRGLRKLALGDGSPTDLAFHPDGERLAAVTWGKAIELWDLASGEILQSIPCDAPFKTLAFDPRGRWLATATKAWARDGRETRAEVLLWDLAAGRVTTRLPVEAFALAVHPDGDRIAVGSNEPVQIWRVGTQDVALELPTRNCRSLAWSASGRWLAAGLHDEVAVFDGTDGSLVRRWPAGRGAVHALAFAADGSILATGGDDKLIRLWSCDALDEAQPSDPGAELLATLRGHDERVTGLGFLGDGRTVVSSSPDGHARRWDARTRGAVHSLAENTFLMDSACAPDGSTLAVTIENGVDIRRLSDGATTRSMSVRYGAAVGAARFLFSRGTPATTCVAFAPSSDRVVSGHADATVRVWDAGRGAQVRELRGHRKQSITAVAWSAEADWIASGGRDRRVCVWSGERDTSRHTFTDHEQPIVVVAFRPGVGSLLSGDQEGVVRVRDPASGSKLAEWDLEHPLMCAAYSPRGDRLVVGDGRTRTLRILDAESGDEIRALRGHERPLGAVAWSPDGARIASCGGGTLRVWDPTTAECLLASRISPDERPLTAASFTPDGKRLIVSSHYGAVYVLESDLAQARALWAGAARRN